MNVIQTRQTRERLETDLRKSINEVLDKYHFTYGISPTAISIVTTQTYRHGEVIARHIASHVNATLAEECMRCSATHEDVVLLRDALAGIIGSSDATELQEMLQVTKNIPGPDDVDRSVMVAAINALLKILSKA